MVKRSSDPNAWYHRNGVEPPLTIPHYSDDDLQKKMKEAMADTKHGDWLQVGNRLDCRRCGNHGFLISTSQILRGTDSEGLPILEDLV